MKGLSVLAMIAVFGTAMAGTDASAQAVNLSGQFRCVQVCAPGLQGRPAFVTQNGYNLSLLNEAGEPSRAWIDWSGHIWAENWHEGALFSSDGMMIQFDRGTIWQRDLGEPPPAIPDRSLGRRARTEPPAIEPPAIEPPAIDRPGKRLSAPLPSRPAPAAPAATAFDGDWSVVIMTQSGGCDRSYRYGVRISNGDVTYDGGGPVDLQGHVYSSGAVRVSVSGGGQQADGQGRLSRTAGSGTWRGQGSLGACAGVWQAERRG
jgi:hypothetical protein